MIFYILDGNFDKIGLIDQYESAIWTDRYLEPGDFELYIKLGSSMPANIAIGRYLVHKDSESMMIIEQLEIKTDAEEGDNVLIVTGRSIESILDRRIVYNRRIFNGAQVFSAIYKIIKYNMLWSGLEELGAAGKRRCIFHEPVNAYDEEYELFQVDLNASSEVMALDETYDLSGEYYGNNILDVVTDICKEKKLGFKIIVRED